MMRDTALSTDPADGGAPSEHGTVTAEYITPDLRPLAVLIDSLRPMPGNARAHGERDLSAIADSLRAHGQQKPIAAKRTYRGLSNVVLAGNGTLQAAKQLGLRFIAVSWFTGSDEEAAAYSVRDNRTSELSRFDASALTALAADADLDLLTLGWNDTELLDLLGPDDAPVPRFEPEAVAHRLDQLAPDTTCPACGHQFKQVPR